MARKPERIAPPAIIAQAAAALYAQIAANTAIADAERELYVNATTKAWNQLMDGVRFEREDDEFVFPSRTRAGLAHRVNGTCTCEASAELGQPCWHRAAKKLVLLMEAPTVPAVPAAAPATPAAPAIPQEGKAIIFDDETRDFAMFYNGAFIGYRATYRHAERDLDDYVYRHRRHAA